jgi:hypothetical protein
MPIYIPEYPAPRPWTRPFPTGVEPGKFFDPKFEPGEAVHAPPYEGEMFLSFTTPPGKISGVYYSLVFQLRKWGYTRYKIEESISVTPVFKHYYDLTIGQRDQLQAMIKSGLASIAQAVADFELVLHDLRKYKEFLDYFTKIEKGKEEKNEELVKEGNQTLKSIFIDQVDVHTGEGIALKLIAPRWPTIIVDFMKLKDEDTIPEKIAKEYKISEAEAVVLATKNKLFIEWRDQLFKPTVIERYKRLRGLAEARKKSIEEYKNALKPTIARFKMINDALEYPAGRGGLHTAAAVVPGAQMGSVDTERIWAWRPFAPAEKYKISREYFDMVDALKAGFNGREKKELIEAGLITKEGEVFALPVEPSIDRIVRFYYQGEKGKPSPIEQEYGVKLEVKDLFRARQMLVDQFRHSYTGLTAIEPWVWSPYFVFLDMKVTRAVFRLPDGTEAEDVEYYPFTTATYSQNLIIVRCLELIAREKQLEDYINTLLGDYGVSGEQLNIVKSIDELVKKDFPEIYETKERRKEKEEMEKRLKKLEEMVSPEIRMMKTFRDIRRAIGKFFEDYLGIRVQFLRAVGPYEFAMQQRMTKLLQVATEGPGKQFSLIKDFLKTKFEVPGATTPW